MLSIAVVTIGRLAGWLAGWLGLFQQMEALLLDGVPPGEGKGCTQNHGM